MIKKEQYSLMLSVCGLSELWIAWYLTDTNIKTFALWTFGMNYHNSWCKFYVQSQMVGRKIWYIFDITVVLLVQFILNYKFFVFICKGDKNKLKFGVTYR